MSDLLNFAGFSEVGQRTNNQDYICHSAHDPEHCVFSVCDGVGGRPMGEEASKLVAETFINNVLETKSEFDYRAYKTSKYRNALKECSKSLKNFEDTVRFSKGLTTTLTGIDFSNKKGVVWLHAGDSKVFWIRDDKIILRTIDQNNPGNNLKIGEINLEQFQQSGDKNKLLNSINAEDSRAEWVYIPYQFIKEGDIFFLCTDGVLENLNDSEFETLLTKHKGVENLSEALKVFCSETSKDNYSSYFIEITASFLGEKLKDLVSDPATSVLQSDWNVFLQNPIDLGIQNTGVEGLPPVPVLGVNFPPIDFINSSKKDIKTIETNTQKSSTALITHINLKSILLFLIIVLIFIVILLKGPRMYKRISKKTQSSKPKTETIIKKVDEKPQTKDNDEKQPTPQQPIHNTEPVNSNPNKTDATKVQRKKEEKNQTQSSKESSTGDPFNVPTSGNN